MKKGYVPEFSNKKLKAPKGGTGESKIIGKPEHYFPISFQQILTICKCKHYRVGGIQGVLNYNKLQELLKFLGLKEDQIKQCMHP